MLALRAALVIVLIGCAHPQPPRASPRPSWVPEGWVLVEQESGYPHRYQPLASALRDRRSAAPAESEYMSGECAGPVWLEDYLPPMNMEEYEAHRDREACLERVARNEAEREVREMELAEENRRAIELQRAREHERREARREARRTQEERDAAARDAIRHAGAERLRGQEVGPWKGGLKANVAMRRCRRAGGAAERANDRLICSGVDARLGQVPFQSVEADLPGGRVSGLTVTGSLPARLAAQAHMHLSRELSLTYGPVSRLGEGSAEIWEIDGGRVMMTLTSNPAWRADMVLAVRFENRVEIVR